MKFQDRTDEEVQLNLTPLIDVVFLLLIFFMVSTTFSKESQLRIKLPEASATEQLDETQRILEIEINISGLYAIKGPADTKARQLLRSQAVDLRRAIRLAAGGEPDLVVVIRADRKTPHEAVIRALDASRRLGYTHITFATQQPVASSDSP